MTRDELIKRLLELPNIEVCVTTDARRETLAAGVVHVEPYADDEGGPAIVITGVEDMAGIFGEPHAREATRLRDERHAREDQRRAAVPTEQYRM